MQSSGWRRRRAQAIRRAGRRCQQCGAGGPLDVHHRSYGHLGDERPYELVALCPDCHGQVHAGHRVVG
jgi:5-methylcytosine-specific restriction endonuclease McrA